MQVLLLFCTLLAIADICVSFIINGSYEKDSSKMSAGFSAATILYGLILFSILLVQKRRAKGDLSQTFEPCTSHSAVLLVGWALILGWIATFIAALVNTTRYRNEDNVEKKWIGGGFQIAVAILQFLCVGWIIWEGLESSRAPSRQPLGRGRNTHELNFVTSRTSRLGAKVSRTIIFFHSSGLLIIGLVDGR